MATKIVLIVGALLVALAIVGQWYFGRGLPSFDRNPVVTQSERDTVQMLGKQLDAALAEASVARARAQARAKETEIATREANELQTRVDQLERNRIALRPIGDLREAVEVLRSLGY